VLPLVSSSGNDQLRVGGTLTNQGGTVFFGSSRCFGGSCPGLFPSPEPTGGPATTVGTLINNGKLYSWSNITASNLTNNGLASFVGGAASAKTLANSGAIYLSNSAASIALQQTAALRIGTGSANTLGYTQFADGILDEVLLGSSNYGQILAGPWQIPPVVRCRAIQLT